MGDEGSELTPAELEIMQVIWARGEVSVHDVIEAVPGDRAYTTISTLIRILEKKGHVASRSEGKRHWYRAIREKPVYETAVVNHLVQRVFGSPAALVRRLLESGPVPDDELEEIRKMIEQRSHK